MTHLAVLALFVVLTLRDLATAEHPLPILTGLAPAAIALGSILPLAAIALAVELALRSLGRTLDRTGAVAAPILAGRILDISRILIVAAHAWAVLGLGWLDLVRAAIGDIPAIDELLAMAPALLAMTLGWSSYHAIDRRIREAGVLGALDRSEHVPRLIPRSTYIIEQLRHNVLFILIPVTLLIAWWEVLILVAMWAADRWPVAARAYEAQWPLTVIHLAGVAMLIALMPLALRRVWRTQRIGPGPLRDRLVSLGAAHAVGFRDVLVWRTHTDIANAAVIGVAPIARFVMLTETLLERLPLIGVEAVMAHEVGHARRHHIPWLMAAMLTTITLTFDAAARIAALIAPTGTTGSLADSAIATALALTACIAALGFVSRRFELQADAFAAQHLSGFRPGRTPRTSPAPPISPEAAYTMINALGAVAALNHSNPRRFTLRHGSIRWRQSHLHNLVGIPADRLPIDRTVKAIKLAILLALAAVIALAFTGA
jgi:STE24 endopeptidase